MKKGRIFVISAPSGTGKSTVVAELRRRFPNLAFSISCTTRPKRSGEKDGVDYHFVDRHEFEQMVDKGGFVEWAEVHDELYGTPRNQIAETLAKGLNIILDIDVQGGMAIKKVFPEAIAVFLLPPTMEALEERLAGRGTDSSEQIKIRMENARREMGFKDQYDDVIVNDEVDRACDDLAHLITGV